MEAQGKARRWLGIDGGPRRRLLQGTRTFVNEQRTITWANRYRDPRSAR
jgi:hypothetical protein